MTTPEQSTEPHHTEPPIPSSPPLINDIRPAQTPTDQTDKNTAWHHIKPIFSVVAFVVGVVVAATLINAFVFQSYYVEGTSMTPTLQNHDRLIIDKFSRSSAFVQGKPYVPERGQIVVLDSTFRDSRGQPEQLIKRIVGLPGERVVIENGDITLYNQTSPNGFDADKALGLALAPTFTAERIETTLDNNEIYVVGDNRAPGGSLDSRSFGAVDIRNIEGRLWARIFPFSSARTF